MPVARLALALLVIALVSACGSTRAAVSFDSRSPLRSVLPNGVPVVLLGTLSMDRRSSAVDDPTRVVGRVPDRAPVAVVRPTGRTPR